MTFDASRIGYPLLSRQGRAAMRKALKVRRTGVPAFLLVRRMPTGGIGRIFSTILLA